MSLTNTSKSFRGENQSLLQDGHRNNGAAITPKKDTSNVGAGESSEKTAFLATKSGGEPVKLTPAWEATDAPDDELNFGAVSMEQATLEMYPPRDRFWLVYLTLMLHGIGTLTPWNMFITAKGYFVDYKLSEPYTGIVSNYATNFLAYVGFAAQVPSLIFNWLNIFMQIGGNLTTRIVWSITIEILVFIFTVILAMMNTAGWPGMFFWITMSSVVLLNMANGIYQNTVYGMAAKLPPKYTGAVVLGSNISGTLTSIINIISGRMSPSVRTAAIYYFITALFILLLCFDTFFALPLNRFYRYHELLNEKQQQAKKNDNHGQKPKTPYWKIFKQSFPQLFNVFFIFFVTLSIFPAVHSDIKRSSDEFFVGSDLYTDVTCYLTFNIFAMIGSYLAAIYSWPKPKYLIIPVVLRVLYIPLFLIFKYEPKNIVRTFPILIENDWVYWITAITMALSSGYFSSVGMMYTPRTVESQHAVTAGMFASAALLSGIFVGVTTSMVWPTFVSSFPSIF